MTIQSISDLIAQHEFFRGLSTAHLELIAGCGKNVHFEAGQYLGREGEPADQFYAIRHGSVVIEIHAPERGAVAVQTVNTGDILGWSWVFPPYRWQFDARAVEPVRATVFDGACLRKKCENDPVLGFELMKRVATLVAMRLRSTRLQLLDLYAPKR
jgi:CRP/FNR family cyclic AMP-dependent transcriptional regulator